MGKKGTKRKTKWRTLPLGEEAGGSSANEEDLQDEDQSTVSSVVEQPAVKFKPQPVFYRMGEKPYRQHRRFLYDRYKSKEPLVKLESKTFDEEEYTKITTPRQDVLFKKGYFGRKRESSNEEATHHSEEVESEEPMMDQIIITNGFVDERGHYLVNGNSYEIYDPYSNTVTVVVGPPPYTNGITQPVLAAVSCQPVPLQPVDWYPPGSDWPSQGSAWTPSYPRSPQSDSLGSPGEGGANFQGHPDGQMPNMFHQPAVVVPGFMYSESPVYNDMAVAGSNQSPTSEASSPNDSEPKDFGEMSKVPNGELEKPKEAQQEASENTIPTTAPKNAESNLKDALVTGSAESSTSPCPKTLRVEGTVEFRPRDERPVEKQNHSTQTSSLEHQEPVPHSAAGTPDKESHSTQTPPEQTSPALGSAETQTKSAEGSCKEASYAVTKHDDKGRKGNWKSQQNRGKDYQNTSPRKFQETSPRKIYQQRTSFGDERRVKTEISDAKCENGSPCKMSYAKKAMAGLEIANERHSKVVNTAKTLYINKIPSEVKNAQSEESGDGSMQKTMANGLPDPKPNPSDRCHPPAHEEKKTVNGHAKTRYVKGGYVSKVGSERNNQKEFRFKERRAQQHHQQQQQRERAGGEPARDKPPEMKDRANEDGAESRSQSEKSSTLSELSSPTDLSSGQNTPPEKLLVLKMEQKIANEISKTFEEKLKQNLTRKKEAPTERAKAEEPQVAEKGKQKATEGRKKNKGKQETEVVKEGTKASKKKKKRAAEEAKDKSESDNSNEEFPFLNSFVIQKPQDLFLDSLRGIRGGGGGNGDDDCSFLIPEMASIIPEEDEILKTLGISEDKLSFSKLPLHSDLLMMLPAFGWPRPKLKIEDIFAPNKRLHSDLFTRRNITSMKSTRPEEFFASVVDGPIAEKPDRKKDGGKGVKKEQANGEKAKKKSDAATKPGNKTNKGSGGKTKGKEEVKVKVKKAVKGPGASKFGIVDAVNTWLQEQGNSEKVLSADPFPVEAFDGAETENGPERGTNSKNAGGNPMHASSGEEDGRRSDVAATEVSRLNECMRVANVINDGFIHIDNELLPGRKTSRNRMNRSSSWDAKFSEAKIKKHLKFLTDSASFCQDLISDARNGLPTGNGCEYATEELCDPRQSVLKYYLLSPKGDAAGKAKGVPESDSENEVFDALEYKFLGKGDAEKRKPAAGDQTGNASVTDSGVHSDMDSSEDATGELVQKDLSCKLQ